MQHPPFGQQAYELRRDEVLSWDEIAVRLAHPRFRRPQDHAANYAKKHQHPWPLPKPPPFGQRAYEMFRDTDLTWEEVKERLGNPPRPNLRSAAKAHARKYGLTWPPRPPPNWGKIAYELKQGGMGWEAINDKLGRRDTRKTASDYAKKQGLTWPLPRPPRTNGAYNPWTEAEREVIRNALAEGLMPREVRHLLPGRSKANVHNGFNLVRRRLRGTCACGVELKGSHTRCHQCRAKTRRKRDAALAKGLCGQCHTAPADFSLTRCTRCAERQAKYKKPKNLNAQDIYHHGLVRWLKTAQPQQINPLFTWDTSQGTYIDLFGGSGVFALNATRHWKHVVYNDTHPLLHNYASIVRRPDLHAPYHEALAQLLTCPVEDILHAYQRLRDNPPVVPTPKAAALFYIVTRSVVGRDLHNPQINKLRPPAIHHRRTLREHRLILREVSALTDLDFADALIRYDSPDTLFFCDPPWPGPDRYEFNMAPERHDELANLLLQIKGRFVIILGSTRSALDHYHRIPHLAWLTGRATKLIVGANFPIPDDTGIAHLDPTRFGYGH
jgi:site-specific DNA-adenine methylase